MLAGHGDREVLDRLRLAGHAVAAVDGEVRLAALERDVAVAHLRLRIAAVGDDAPVLDPGDERLHLRVVEAHHREAVERHVLDEGAERLAQRVERAVMVEVLRVDVGDDDDVGGKLDEGAVGLVGLHHHPVARRPCGHWCRRR